MIKSRKSAKHYRKNSRMVIEIALVGCVSILIFVVLIQLDAVGRLQSWISRYESILKDYLICGLLVLAAAIGALSLCRWIDLSGESRKYRQEVDDLSGLNDVLKKRVTGRMAEVQVEQEKTQAILKNIGDAIAVTDPSMIVQSVNDSFSRLTGYSEMEIAGRPLHILAAEPITDELWPLLNFPAKSDGVREGQVILRCKDGRPYDAMLVLAPLRNAEDDHTGYVSSHRDTSHIMELKRARNQIITNVSHELRTPVANIKLYIQLLQMGKRPEKTEHYLDVLYQQAARLEDLIQDILEIVALDSSRGASVWKPVRLALIIDNIVEQYQQSAEISGLRLESEAIPKDLPLVKGDQSRLSQALGELVENAITFTPVGGTITITTKMAVKNDRQMVTISVQDTGPGISKVEQARIFDRFYRGNLAESGHIPGTGLGLSIVKEIMAAHGGDLTVSSELGHGAIFTLWLQSVSQENYLE